MCGRAGEVWREFEAARFQVPMNLRRALKQSLSWFSLFSPNGTDWWGGGPHEQP